MPNFKLCQLFTGVALSALLSGCLSSSNAVDVPNGPETPPTSTVDTPLTEEKADELLQAGAGHYQAFINGTLDANPAINAAGKASYTGGVMLFAVPIGEDGEPVAQENWKAAGGNVQIDADFDAARMTGKAGGFREAHNPQFDTLGYDGLGDALAGTIDIDADIDTETAVFQGTANGQVDFGEFTTEFETEKSETIGHFYSSTEDNSQADYAAGLFANDSEAELDSGDIRAAGFFYATKD